MKIDCIHLNGGYYPKRPPVAPASSAQTNLNVYFCFRFQQHQAHHPIIVSRFNIKLILAKTFKIRCLPQKKRLFACLTFLPKI